MNNETVQNGVIVTLNYEGKLKDGQVFDSSYHGDHSHPLTSTVGAGEVVPGFDEAVVGMKVGEEKTFTIPANKAYGERNEELMQGIPRENLPKDQEPAAGMMLLMQTPDGHEVPVKIAKVSATLVTLDLNHPLAGQDLTFSIKIDKIEKADGN